MEFKDHSREFKKKLYAREILKLKEVGEFLKGVIKKAVRRKGTGRKYKVYTGKKGVKRRRIHIASAPFNPPAKFFGGLGRSVASKVRPKELSVRIGVFKNSEASAYARALEMGTPTMKRRSYLRPALYREKNNINRILNK